MEKCDEIEEIRVVKETFDFEAFSIVCEAEVKNFVEVLEIVSVLFLVV